MPLGSSWNYFEILYFFNTLISPKGVANSCFFAVFYENLHKFNNAIPHIDRIRNRVFAYKKILTNGQDFYFSKTL